MSKKRVYNITTFDGGITDNIRSNDFSKCAYVSHFDIYRDPHRLYPMPGYIDDMNDGSTSNGMKQYGVRAFLASYGGILAVGTKSDGTGWRIFHKSSITSASWDITPFGSSAWEGTYTLYPRTFLAGDESNMFFLTTNAGKTWLTKNNAGTATENYDEVLSFAQSSTAARAAAEFGADGNTYTTRTSTDIIKISGGTGTDSAFSTGMRAMDVAAGDEQLGIFGFRYSPHFAQLLLWDYASTLASQKIQFGKGRGTALGYISGAWIGIVDENLTSQSLGFDDEVNGRYAFAVKYAVGGTAETLTRVYGKTNTNAYLFPNRGKFRDAMLFEARVPTDANGTTFKGGIWAVGRNSQGGIALSHLLDTESLGSVQAAMCAGEHFLLAHGGDGSISRLDNLATGTFDVTAVYESLMFGADSPNWKTLNGMSVLTENLPASGSVVVKYRTDEDSSWTTIGTSSTAGTQVHNFTRPGATMIGRFQEIQFRVEVTGNAPVKNIYISLEEQDTTPYDT
jgi:hypothetical protein